MYSDSNSNYQNIERPKNDFNPAPAHIMHLDINSCFATIEQQSNPDLRGKPVGIVASPNSRGCLISVSIEAKNMA